MPMGFLFAKMVLNSKNVILRNASDEESLVLIRQRDFSLR